MDEFADLSEVDRAFDQLANALSVGQLQRVADAAAAPIRALADAKVPKRSGETQRHIDVERSHTSHSATTSVVVEESGPGGTVHKAVFVEYGTEKMAAEPFMRPAFEQGKDASVHAAEQAFGDLLKPFT